MSARVARREVVVAEAEPGHVPGLKFSAKTSKRPARSRTRWRPARVLQVDGDAALVQVVAQERGADRCARRDRSSPAASRGPSRRRRVLDLDDLGAEARQELGGEGQRLHLLERQDPDAVERLSRSVRRPRSRSSPSFIAASRPPRLAAPAHGRGAGRDGGRVRSRQRWLRSAEPSRRMRYRCRGLSATAAYLPRTGGSTGRASRGLRARAAARAAAPVASYDEDTTTMGVEAARLALRSAAGSSPATLWFSTTSPAYLDKTNATTIHAALRLDRDVVAADAGGAVRSGVAASRTASHGTGAALVVGGRHPRRPADERRRGRRRRRRRRRAWSAPTATDRSSPSSSASASATEEFLDRWRAPGDTPLEGLGGALRRGTLRRARRAGLERGAEGGRDRRRRVDRPDRRRPARPGRALRSADASAADKRTWSTTWTPPSATPARRIRACCSASALEARAARRGDRDCSAWPTAPTCSSSGPPPQVARWHPARRSPPRSPRAGPPLRQVPGLAGILHVEPPRRPDPARVSAPAAGRPTDGSSGSSAAECPARATLHLPPPHVRGSRTAVDETDPAPMADVHGTVATFTVDRLAYSPSPPVVFAVVDFDGGGRLPVELTDVDPDEVAIGDRVEMTFRGCSPPTASSTTSGRPARSRRRRASPEEDDIVGSHGIKDRGGHRRDGLHPVRRALGQGRRRLLRRGGERRVRLAPASTSRTVDAYWLGTALSGDSAA